MGKNRRDFLVTGLAGLASSMTAVESSALGPAKPNRTLVSDESMSLAEWGLKVARRSTVATGSIPRHRAFPGIEKLRNGDILVTYREGSDHWKTPDGVVRLVRSKDGGLTWSEPKTVFQSKGINCGAHLGISQLSDGSILLPVQCILTERWGSEFAAYNRLEPFSGRGPWRIQASMMRSNDDGETWTQPETPALLSSDFWWNTYGKIYQVEKSATVFWLMGRQKKGEAFWRTGLLVSRDLGRSWTEWRDVAVGLAEEKSIVPIAGSRLLALVRDLKPPYVLWQTESSDGGLTWSPCRSSGFLGHCPCLLRTSRGVLLCAHRKLDPGEPPGLGLNYSFDEGRSWQPAKPLYVSPEPTNHDCSYPAMVQLDSREMLCVYYTTFRSGNSDIESVLLREE